MCWSWREFCVPAGCGPVRHVPDRPGRCRGTCRFWHVALRQLPDSDPLGEQVTHIKTNLGLAAEDQAALTVAAARLVAKGFEAMNGMAGGRFA